MKQVFTRRDFMRASVLAVGGAALSTNFSNNVLFGAEDASPFTTKLHSATIVGGTTRARSKISRSSATKS